MSIIYLVMAILVGMLISWFFMKQVHRAKSISLEERMQSLQIQKDQLSQENQASKSEAEKYRSSADVLSREKAQLEEQTKRIPIVEAELLQQKHDNDRKQSEITELKTSSERLSTLLDAERKQSEEKLKILMEAKDQLKTEFENLANRIFEEKGTKFTEQNKTNLDGLLTPLKDQLKDFKAKVETVYDSETQQRSALLKEIQILKTLNNEISEEARNLTKALKSESKTQGNWGEVILERILENSGLRKDIEYQIQPSYRDIEGNMLRPDVVVMLPGKKHVVIDSKVSLKDYESYISGETDEIRSTSFKAHITSIRNHIKGLSSKEYESIKDLHAPDFVLMFIPIESAFLAAIEKDNTLFSDAFNKNIVIVCPSTLLVTLRTIQNIWTYEYQNRNSKEIAEQAGRLYDKFLGFLKNLEDIQKHLDRANKSADDAMKQLSTGNGNLVVSVEKLKKLGAKTNKQLDSNLVEIAEAMDDSEEIIDQSLSS